MLLTIDVGNSNIKFGLFLPGGDLCCSWRAVTVRDKMADEYAVLLYDYFSDNGFTFRDVNAAIMASVVPDLTPTLTELCQRYLRITPMLVEAGMKTGLRLRIDNPLAVGADRVVNVAAARALYGGPVVVLDCGTATKWEALDADGDFLGGAIGPGIGLLPPALANANRDLPRVKLVEAPGGIGTNPAASVQSGLFWGALGMIEAMIRRFKAELGAPDARVIATGGLTALFAPHTPLIDVYDPALTLKGLHILYELNAMQEKS
jgi:type III pantothenate kinase